MNATPDSVAVWELLRSIPDPEFDINIVDLGLIYSVVGNEGDISVVMTLTTSSCPSGGWSMKASGKRQQVCRAQRP